MQTETVRQLFEEMKVLNVVDTLAQFSNICGRKNSWASSFISRDFDMPLDALTVLYCNLLNKRQAVLRNGQHREAEMLAPVQEKLWRIICERANKRTFEIYEHNTTQSTTH